MADAGYTTLRITKLNNSNYQIWKFKAEMLLTKEDLWNVISQEAPDPVTNEWRAKDSKSRATVALLLEDNQLHLIRKEQTAKGTWTVLQRYHEKSTLSNKVSLLKKLFALKLTDDGNMEKHLTVMQDLIDQLSSLGETLAEQLTVALFLSSLPDSYSTLITALETRPEDDLTVELVKNKLLEEYKRRTEYATALSSDSEQKALKAAKERDKVTGASSSSVSGGTRITCYFCKKPNHMKKECKKYIEWKRKNPDHRAKAASQNVYADADDDVKCDTDMCFGAGSNTADRTQQWYIDSGATSHMCSDRNFFATLNENHRSQVVLADGQKLSAAGIGEGILKCDCKVGESRRAKLTDVLYVPQLKGNLLSVKKLTARGLEVNFKNNECAIKKEGRILAEASEVKGLYELNTSQNQKVLMTADEKHQSCIHAWHNRLGHRDPNAIKLLQEQAAEFSSEPCSVSMICESCIKAKMTRKPFPQKSECKTTAVLDLIHTDVCGPMQTMTPGKNRYFMTMIDDYSKFTKVYLLKNKSEVPEKVKEYVNFVQTKFQVTPKKIRSDRSGEYTGEAMKNYLKSSGIQADLTVPNSPQQNGCAERKNRYLVEMTRTMLVDSGLPNKYWGEAIMTANHLQNILPTAGEDRTPFEKWNGRKPNMNYIRRFGCAAFTAVPAVKRQKLDDKAIKLTFVGYEEGTKGYRLLDTKTDRIHISRDVIFLEGDPHRNSVNPDLSFGGTPKAAADISNSSNSDIEVILEPITADSKCHEELPDLQEQEQVAEVRQSTRQTKGIPPQRLIDTMNKVTTIQTEPKTFKDAQSCSEAKYWSQAMDEEMNCLRQNETWTLTELPEGKTAIGSKWVYKLKTDEEGNITRYKARLVAQGYSQKYGDDYDEVFAPVAKAATLRILLTVAGQQKMIVKHYDIQSAYLNGNLSHEVYMKQPDGYQSDEKLVCKLNKSLYGLKQGANEWNKRLHEILSSNGFKRSDSDSCLYAKCEYGEWMYISIHVDDLIVATSSTSMIEAFENQMNSVIVMRDMGNLKYYLGLQIERDIDGIFLLHQKSYIEKKLKEFNLSDCRPSSIPVDPGYQRRSEVHEDMKNKDVYRKAIGSLQYLATNTRPDIAVGTSILARHVSEPKEADWTEVKRIFRYLTNTKDLKLKLGIVEEQDNKNLICYADADWAGDVQDRKSNTGYNFKYFGAPVTWSSREQSLVALSSTEAEYIALSEAVQEALWIRKLLEDFNQELLGPTVVYEDNQSCIRLLQNEKACQRTKHIDTKYHFIRELQKLRAIDVKYCPSVNMTADLLTKPLEAVKLRQFMRDIGLTLTV